MVCSGLENQAFLLAEPLRLGKYRHFKGGMYQVLATARDSETEEWMVVYQPLYVTAGEESTGKKTLWVRPMSMFLETVENKGQAVQRFTYIEENA